MSASIIGLLQDTQRNVAQQQTRQTKEPKFGFDLKQLKKCVNDHYEVELKTLSKGKGGYLFGGYADNMKTWTQYKQDTLSWGSTNNNGTFTIQTLTQEKSAAELKYLTEGPLAVNPAAVPALTPRRYSNLYPGKDPNYNWELNFFTNYIAKDFPMSEADRDKYFVYELGNILHQLNGKVDASEVNKEKFEENQRFSDDVGGVLLECVYGKDARLPGR
jgi:hypothetical protein